MDAVTIDVTRVEVALRFRLATIAIYRSSSGVVALGRPPTGLRTTVCVVWNCFHKRELQNDEHRRKEQHLGSTALL
ncbi:uncharacterized protein TNCV_3431981 [Trichonephila clavipes]|nr:uncharacterized protein TNCV_3431981 [Trichonephila clavipes]